MFTGLVLLTPKPQAHQLYLSVVGLGMMSIGTDKDRCEMRIRAVKPSVVAGEMSIGADETSIKVGEMSR
jgi:hypothetical protein